MAVIHCRNCGRELSPDDRFCPQCGTKVEPDADGQDARPQAQTKLDVETERISSEQASRLYEVNQERKKNRKAYNIEDFNWDLNGYPSQGAHKTEDVDFHWDSVRPRRRRAPEDDVIDFSQHPEENTNAVEPPEMPEEAGMDQLGPELDAEEDQFQEEPAKTSAEKIDKFFTYSTKNAEFQDLLDQEYSKLADEDNTKARHEAQRIADARQEELQSNLDKLMGLVGSAKSAASAEPASAPAEDEAEPAAEEAAPSAAADHTESGEAVSAAEGNPEPEETAPAAAQEAIPEEEKPEEAAAEQSTAKPEPAVEPESAAEPASGAAPEDETEPPAAEELKKETDTAASEPAAAAESEAAPEDIPTEKPAKPAEPEPPERAAEETAAAAVPAQKGGVTSRPHDPEARKKDFNDIFSEENKPEPPERKHPVLRVIGIIILIIILLEVAAICIRQFAPDSAAGVWIQTIYDRIFQAISGS